VRPIAIFDGFQLKSELPFYSLVFLCRYVEGEITLHPKECLDGGWFSRSELPANVGRYATWVDIVFDAIEDPTRPVYFDPVRPEKIND
jgi:hypothetical protein